MSAGTSGEYPGEPPLTIYADYTNLAPGFVRMLESGIAECTASGLDAVMHEGYRSRETALVYYARGRTTIPPNGTVTNAQDETHSYHGYGMAADIISRAHGWEAGQSWFTEMGRIMKKQGLVWGGDWIHCTPDLPHVQVKTSFMSPSEHARELLASGGLLAVWQSCGIDV